jgi:hypothetical protein
MLVATLVAPGHNRVVPLIPEFIVPRDGHDKPDRESCAARRWLAANGPSHASLNPIIMGDDLFSRQPIREAVLAAGMHVLFVCKPSSHPAVEDFRTGVVLDELKNTVKRGSRRFTWRYRWMNEVPARTAPTVKHELAAWRVIDDWPERMPRSMCSRHGLATFSTRCSGRHSVVTLIHWLTIAVARNRPLE